MTQPVDHSVLIEQLESWATRLNTGNDADLDRVIDEMRQVAKDLAREDAQA